MKILVVEDEAFHESLIAKVFSHYKNDFEVHFEHSCEAGCERVKQSELDLLICDLLLPDGNGLDIVEMINSQKLDLPVIVLTGDARVEEAVKSFKLGVMDYLMKGPEVYFQLPRIAREVIRQWKKRQDHLRSEKRLLESERKYRMLTENISDVVWFVDPSFMHYTYLSPSVERFLGYPVGELLVLPFHHTLNYDSSKRVEAILRRLRALVLEGKFTREDTSMEMELEFEHRDGSARWGEVKSTLIYQQGKILGISGVTRDVTDRKIAEARAEELERLRQKVKVSERVGRIKEQFLANMSHEIRSPLTGIMGMTELLGNTPLTDTQKFYLDTIHASSASLLDFVNQIMDMARIKEGKMELNPVRFHLQEHALRNLNLFSALMARKGLEKSFQFDDLIPPYIVADARRLGQIMVNLLDNAVKFTKNGFVKMSLMLLEEQGSELTIRLEVQDSGIGIPRKGRVNMFKVFSMGDDSDTRSQGGAGLGLALSQRFAILMGGKIGMESTPGEGSRFWLDFKAVRAEEQYPEGEQQQSMPQPIDFDCNVLLVEDKKTIQLVVSLMLQEAGCQVETASHGQEALEKFVPGKYHLILMDIQMPVMDGLSATKELRKRYAREQLPPIVALSARALEGDAAHYISEGLDDYITKPVTAVTLRNKVIEWVGAKGG